jgi:hypothetical protein
MKVRGSTSTPKSSFGRRPSSYETEPKDFITNVCELDTSQYESSNPIRPGLYGNIGDIERNLTIYNIDIDKLAMNQILDVTREFGCEEEANPHRLTYQSYNDSEYEQNENESSMNSEIDLESIQRSSKQFTIPGIKSPTFMESNKAGNHVDYDATTIRGF